MTEPTADSATVPDGMPADTLVSSDGPYAWGHTAPVPEVRPRRQIRSPAESAAMPGSVSVPVFGSVSEADWPAVGTPPVPGTSLDPQRPPMARVYGRLLVAFAVFVLDVVIALADLVASMVISLFRLPWFDTPVVFDPTTLVLMLIGPAVTVGLVLASIWFWHRHDRPELVLVQQVFLVVFVATGLALVVAAT